MATINFYLRDKTVHGLTSIYAHIRYNNKVSKIRTGEKIEPENWSSLKKTFKPSYPNKLIRETRLNEIKNIIETCYLEYKGKEKREPSAAEIKKIVEFNIFGGTKDNEIPQDFFGYFEYFINGQRKIENPKTGKKLNKETINGYTYTLRTLKDFEIDYKFQISFNSIDLEFYHLFIEYLEFKGYKKNYIGKHIKVLRTVLNSATSDGVNKNLRFKSRKFIIPKEETTAVFLNLEELKELEELDLSKNKRLDKARDLFLLLCYTGQRVQSLRDLVNPKNRNEEFIRIKQHKTGVPVTIPILPEVRRIFDKYKKLEVITDQRLNVYIKEVCQKIPSLNKLVENEFTKSGLKVKKRVPKYSLITTHTGRRSFCTNFYLNKEFPISLIMKISGHTKESTFYKYIRATPDDSAKRFLEIYNKSVSERKLKLL